MFGLPGARAAPTRPIFLRRLSRTPSAGRTAAILSCTAALVLVGCGGAARSASHTAPRVGSVGHCRAHALAPRIAMHVLRIAKGRLLLTVRRAAPGEYPSVGDRAGNWVVSSAGDWTSGFFPGSLWLATAYDRDPRLARAARSSTAGLAGQAGVTSSHDVGFQIFTSFGNGYRLTGNPHYLPVILRAARSLASRYSPTVAAVRSWGPRDDTRHFEVIVDNLMNLELLFWAARHGGTQGFARMAMHHALTTARYFVRHDGSTVHLVDFDPRTGSVISDGNPQGYRVWSTWSRGQAWAISGLTLAFGETRNIRLLAAARKTAAWFVAHLPAGCVPAWDFGAPATPRRPLDTSAAAVAADGLLELSRLEPDRRRGLQWSAAATSILASLISHDLAARGEALLAHGTPNHPGGLSDVATSYGDYYFVHALERYVGILRQ